MARIGNLKSTFLLDGLWKEKDEKLAYYELTVRFFTIRVYKYFFYSFPAFFWFIIPELSWPFLVGLVDIEVNSMRFMVRGLVPTCPS